MLIHPFDATTGPDEWLPFLRAQGFGQLIAAGRGRDVPVVVPTQYLIGVDSPLEILLHLARPNPIWAALAENPMVLLSVAGDWAYIPAAGTPHPPHLIAPSDRALRLSRSWGSDVPFVLTNVTLTDQHQGLPARMRIAAR